MLKTILITGSSRGIGRATALLAAKQGYKVIVHGKTDSAELQKVHESIPDSTKTFFDITDKNATRDAIQSLGSIDILVNNAGWGISGIKDISEINDTDALKEYKINVLGMIHCVQAVLPGMLDVGAGSVVSISSIKGHYNLANMSSFTYAPSKAGVIALTKALAKTYPKIRFNSVSPGYVETDQAKEWDEATLERINTGTVMGRMANPDEIANAVIFLASEQASYITGTDLLVDGGFSIKGK